MPKPAVRPVADKPELISLFRAIFRDDLAEVAKALQASPTLAREALIAGAARQSPFEIQLDESGHYFYAGDTPLHAAAACYRVAIARLLLQNGAAIAARNRRGAEPIHYAADGSPGSRNWNPPAQAAIIDLLVAGGANPNAPDKSGVAPLHRAIRQRCPAAVEPLLRNGADVRLTNKNKYKSGSTPLRLATLTTGRGGSGTPGAKICQRQIIALLLAAGADPRDAVA